jgi:hypothetical protein
MRTCRKKDVLVAFLRCVLDTRRVWLLDFTLNEPRNIKMMR